MLKVTLHHAPPERVGLHNVIGRLDIGYAKLSLYADYKLVMTAAGVGELPPRRIQGYPRWSASVWDLVARAICLCLTGREGLGPELHGRKGAFFDHLTAVIEHWQDGVDTRRATVGTAYVQMRRRRCHYEAVFEDDLCGEVRAQQFCFAPEGLDPWELLARAYAWAAHKNPNLPRRPAACIPIPIEYAGASFVSLDTVPEPARTGIARWLQRTFQRPVSIDLVDGPCVPEKTFAQFLETAV